MASLVMAALWTLPACSPSGGSGRATFCDRAQEFVATAGVTGIAQAFDLDDELGAAWDETLDLLSDVSDGTPIEQELRTVRGAPSISEGSEWTAEEAAARQTPA